MPDQHTELRVNESRESNGGLSRAYRGRIAPSPTGKLHLGHARTFWVAAERAREKQGTLIFRNDDLDRERCREEFVAAAIHDLHWLDLNWTEGPDVGGPHAPYTQSARLGLYRKALETLHRAGLIFPCTRSRRDVIEAAGAPHEQGGDEPIYPTAFRPDPSAALSPLEDVITVNWRFRVPDGETLQFTDGALGLQTAVAGREFGDFLVWRKDHLPSYQLACVVDDALMSITEVVRGADLVMSTFRQQLLYRAFGWAEPSFYHCPLVHDERGTRLAKRHDASSLSTLRNRGETAESLIANFEREYREWSLLKP
ncbi:MAG TPA: glutamate--tRNA ligase family protein [Opitutaceae bacterium]